MSNVTVKITDTPVNIRFPVSVPGPAGTDGADGQGVPTGGTAGQYLEKVNGTDYNTQWATFDAAFLFAAFDTLDDYNSDTAAVSGGLTVGQYYITSDGHETLPAGVIKKITP